MKTKLSSSFDDGTYYEYKVKSTTSAKLLLQIVATTTGGAGMNIFTYDFNFDLISGSKKVKESYEFKHYEDYIGPPKN